MILQITAPLTKTNKHSEKQFFLLSVINTYVGSIQGGWGEVWPSSFYLFVYLVTHIHVHYEQKLLTEL